MNYKHKHLEHEDKKIYDIYIAGRTSAALAAAVRIGLFDLLREKPMSETEIIKKLGFYKRPMKALLLVLRAMKLIVRKDEAEST
jgi:predicted transcriptional regulator